MAVVDKNRLARFKADSAGAADFIKINFLKFDSNLLRLRILPGQEPGNIEKDFYVKTMLHYGAVPSNPRQYIICPKTTDPKAVCPVCNEVQRLKANASKFDEAEIMRLKAKPRYAIGVLPRDGKQADEICVFMAPKQVFTQITDLMNNEDYGDITHPFEGYDVRISKKGEGRNIQYMLQPTKKASQIVDDEEQLATILNDQPDLWRFRLAADPNEIQALLDGEITVLTTGFGQSNTFKKAEEEVEESTTSEEDFSEEDVQVEEEETKPVKQEPVKPEPVKPPMNKAAVKSFTNLDAVKQRFSKG